MNNTESIQFSYMEISVLSALLGYDSVFGISIPLYIAEKGNIKQCVKHTVEELEKNNILHYELDGTLLVRPNVRVYIECLSDADTVLVIATNFRTGKNEVMYVLQKGNYSILLEKVSEENYRLQCVDENTIKDMLSITYSDSQSVIDERILFMDALAAHNSINDFSISKSKEILNKYLTSDVSIDVILDVLSKKGFFFRTKIYKNNNCLYKIVHDSLIVKTSEQLLNIKLEDNDILKFSTVSSSAYAKEINSVLNLLLRGGESYE